MEIKLYEFDFKIKRKNNCPYQSCQLTRFLQNKPKCTTAYFTLQMQQNKICQWTCGISFDLEKFIANSFVA